MTENRVAEAPAPLMLQDDEDSFRARWSGIQADFVDEPIRSVQQADDLVADVMKKLTDTFAVERAKLEEQWARQDAVSTENLRIVLQRYRSFFDRLLGLRAS
jgi:hypothetical protein